MVDVKNPIQCKCEDVYFDKRYMERDNSTIHLTKAHMREGPETVYTKANIFIE